MYEHIIRAVFDTPWALLPAKMLAICELVQLRASGGRVPQAEIDEIVAANPRPLRGQSGSVAIVPVFGVMAQRANMMTEMSGGTSTETLGAALRQLVADDSIGSIILNIDSPGGAVAGVPELADLIQSLRGTKPIVAHANAFAASAAYWIGSQADEFVVTPSGQVGSIGVAFAHTDESAANEQAGIKVEYITAGKHKREITSDAPLDDEGRTYLQGMVNEYYDMFVKAVARGRGVSVAQVRGGMGEGRMITARDAVKQQMVDRVETLDATIARLQGGSGRARSRPAAEEIEPIITAEAVGAEPPEPESAREGSASDLEPWRLRLRLQQSRG